VLARQDLNFDESDEILSRLSSLSSWLSKWCQNKQNNIGHVDN